MSLDYRHQCLIYEGSPAKQLPALAAAIKQKLAENYRCLYLNSAPMVADMRASLAAAGVDVEREITKTGLILSTDTAVSAEGNFDSDLMIRDLENAIDQALKDGFKGLYATGDMTWEFGSKESFSRLLGYEWKLEKLFHKRQELSGICQYHCDSLPRDVVKKGFLSHKMIFVNETLSRINHHHVQSESLIEQKMADPELDKALTVLLEG